MEPPTPGAMYDPHVGDRPLQGIQPHLNHNMHYPTGGNHVSPVTNHVMGPVPDVHKTDKDSIYGLSGLSTIQINELPLDGPRRDVISWDTFFMSTAFLAAKRSKDPVTQVGACIVNKDKKIVGIGYNGMPNGCSDEEFTWSKNNPDDNKFLYVCHAEMNAIMNKNVVDLKGCSIYVGLFPCNECSKLIIQSGISEVVYCSDKNGHKPKTIASKRMLNAANVKLRQYIPSQEEIVIKFQVTEKVNSSEKLYLSET